jgi:uncharacterized protein YndB with AHSA1/START domain
MEASESIQREMTIDADAATVFAFFTDPERLMRWVGVAAELEPQRGGIMLVEVHPGHVARGEFKEVVPVSRLAYTWGWEGSDKVPPGSSLIEVDLTPNNGSTVVRFTHRGLPRDEVAGHRDGWNHYLGRLAIAAVGGDPGPDPRIMRDRV